MEIREPWFSEIKNGNKIIEGRLAKNKFLNIRVGDRISVTNEFGDNIVLRMIDIRRYSTFHEMLLFEKIENVLPGVDTIEEGVKIYHKFYSEKDEKNYGVLAFEVCYEN